MGVPVIPTIAIKGLGIAELLKESVDIIEHRAILEPIKFRYGKEVEERIEDFFL